MAYRKFTKYRGQIYQKFISNANFKYLLLCNLLENKIILLIVSFEKNRRQTSSNLLYSFKKKKNIIIYFNFLSNFHFQISPPLISQLTPLKSEHRSMYTIESFIKLYPEEREIRDCSSKYDPIRGGFSLMAEPRFRSTDRYFQLEPPSTLPDFFFRGWNRVDGARGAETRVSGRKARSQHTIRRRTRPVK